MFTKKKSKTIKIIIFYSFALFFCIKSSLENFKTITIYIGGIEINNQHSKSSGTNFLPNKIKEKEKILDKNELYKTFFPKIAIKKAFMIAIFFASFFIIKIIKNKIKNFSILNFTKNITSKLTNTLNLY
jgi:hypothetical protein